MTLETLRAVTPYITLAIGVGLGIIGWLVRRLITQNVQLFENLVSELTRKVDERTGSLDSRIRQLERDLEKFEHFRMADQKFFQEQYVPKDGFYRTMNRTESAIGRIFKLINDLSRAVHQSMGSSKQFND